jgi:hypothetical protein
MVSRRLALTSRPAVLKRLNACAPAPEVEYAADMNCDNTQFAVTIKTEVFLNGQLCSYEQIPADASIVRMEVAQDKKTVLRIYFRTRR